MTSAVGVLDETALRFEAPGLPAAWLEVLGSPLPDRVQRIHRKKRSRVYRLPRPGGGGHVIAKNCTERALRSETIVYEVLLPGSGLRSVQVHGSTRDASGDDHDRSHWLFLEDLGTQRYDPTSSVQRRKLAEWLGRFATVAVADTNDPVIELPVRRTAYYAEFLADGLSSLPTIAETRELAGATRRDLAATVELLEVVNDRWDDIEAVVSAAPTVAAHGDCLSKNIHVTTRGEVVPIDWGSLGWGTPAADLGVSMIELGGKPVMLTPDAGSYVAQVRPEFPDLTVERVLELATVGRLLYLVKLIAQSAPTFQHASRHKVAGILPEYRAALALAVGQAGLKS